ncbi:helix-turn-helix domain-containing protein [Streptomyces sp. LP11]|uniref:Helix-turn-helix domain-containing protein n=1 Tax=Streptomyces pyxinicus TaxID=2970331 RepID=A0ABT2AW63_9ACTN|nr:helix-turn-helix transcriptional regulator [Streptomyces sp. LP11]MCS0600486.1 helix-turn-helix domain-containing protein [Streptomyces sp. LP11]
MVKQLPGIVEPDDGDGHRTGRRGVVRYLHDEASPSAPRMLLGRALRDWREERGLKQQEVARRLGFSPSKLSRTESGHHEIKEQDLHRLLAIYEITAPQEQQALIDLARIAGQPTWWHPWSAVAQRYLQTVVSFEDLAVRIRSFDVLYLHGLLQTKAYAQALIERGRGTRDTHLQLVNLRSERHTRFATAKHKKMICVIHEGVLRHPVGTREVMAEQIDHLITLSQDDNRFQIRLAEFDCTDMPIELGATTIFDFKGRVPKIAYAESLDGGLFIQDETMVDNREKAFDKLLVRSLEPEATRLKLQQLATDHYR